MVSQLPSAESMLECRRLWTPSTPCVPAPIAPHDIEHRDRRGAPSRNSRLTSSIVPVFEQIPVVAEVRADNSGAVTEPVDRNPVLVHKLHLSHITVAR